MPALVTFIVLSLACGPALAANAPTNARSALNQFLEMSVPSDDFRQNFEWIRDTLEGKHQIPLAGNELRKMHKNLEEFLLLDSLRNDQDCGVESYRILADNNDRNGDNAHTKQAANMNRIDTLLHKVMLDHARSCREVHFANFEKLHQSLDQADEEAVRSMFDRLILSKPESLNWQKLAYRDIVMNYLLPALSELAANEPSKDLLEKLGSQKWVSSEDREKVRSMINRYLLEPCQNLIDTFGNFYEVARFDDVMVPISLGSPDRQLFADTFNRYSMCTKVTGHWRKSMEEFFLKVVLSRGESFSEDVPRI